MVDGMAVAAERIRRLTRERWLTKDERDALRHALVIMEDAEQMFEEEGLTLSGD